MRSSAVNRPCPIPVRVAVLLVALATLGGAVVVPAGAARADTVGVSSPEELVAAFAGATTRTVTLGADLAGATAARLDTPAGSDITLDLAGRELVLSGDDTTGTLVLGAGATLRVTDSVGSGTLDVTNTRAGAGIGVPADATLRVAAGTVTARGGVGAGVGDGGGAGIGSRGTQAGRWSPERDVGTVVVTGGTVRAVGGTGAEGGSGPEGPRGGGPGGAGIGGGGISVGGVVLQISGGLVEATGGAGAPDGHGMTSAGGAAGVGSGGNPPFDHAQGATLTMTGGELRATGGGGGASGVPGSPVGGGGGDQYYHPTATAFGSATIGAGAVLVLEGRQLVTAGATFVNDGLVVNNGSITGPGTLASSGTVTGPGSVSVATVTGQVHTFLFDTAGGAVLPGLRVLASSVADAGSALPVPVRDGHLFLGWFAGTTRVQGDTALAGLAVPGGDVAVVARWAEVTLAGTPRVGQELAAEVEVDPGPGTFPLTYDWRSSGQSSGTGDRLLLTAAQRGAAVVLRVATPLPSGYADVATVTRTSEVVLDVQTTGPVTVTGLPRVGATLTAGTDLAFEPAGGDLSYTWLADGLPVAGAVDGDLVLTPALRGSRVSVVVTSTQPGYLGASVTSPEVGPVAPGQPTTAQLTVAVPGTPRVGEPLTFLAAGSFSPAPDDVAVQWATEAGPVPGATAETYTPTADDLGRRLTVTLTATTDGYLPASVTSTPSAPVTATFAATRPVVDGTAQVGRTLVVDTAVPSVPQPETVAVQWLADGVDLAGATSASYTVPAELEGATLSVRLTLSRAHVATAEVVSAPTAPVLAAPRLTVSAPDGIHPGAVLTVAGERFVSAPTFALEVHSTPVLLETVRATGAGTFLVEVTLPTALPVGAHELVVVTGTGDVLARLPIAVAAAPAVIVPAATAPAATSPAATAPALARTGAAAGGLLLLAGALVVGGAGLRRVGRRRV